MDRQKNVFNKGCIIFMSNYKKWFYRGGLIGIDKTRTKTSFNVEYYVMVWMMGSHETDNNNDPHPSKICSSL